MLLRGVRATNVDPPGDVELPTVAAPAAILAGYFATALGRTSIANHGLEWHFASTGQSRTKLKKPKRADS